MLPSTEAAPRTEPTAMPNTPSRRNGFVNVRAINWAYEQRTGSTTAKAVLLALAKHVDDAGCCYPGQEQLAWLTEMSVRSVRRALLDMEAAGLLTRQPRHRPNGHRKSDLYRLNLDGPPDTVTGGQSDRGTGRPPVNEARPPDTVSETTGQSVLAELTTEQTEEETDTPARDAFAAFWPIYPRRVGKPAAAKAFAAAVKRAPVEVILTGVRRYADDPNLPPEQFIPHPATWLRADRWDDPAEPARTDRRPTPSQAAAGWLSTVAALLPTDHPAPRALPGGTA